MARKQGSEIWIDIIGIANNDNTSAPLSDSDKTVKCKLCGSTHIVKYGLSKGVQCWWCKDCCHKFVENRADPGMKLPKEQIAFTLTMYYEGMGFTAICRYLKEKYNSCPSGSTLYTWLMRFSETVISAAQNEHPQVSGRWIAVLTPLKIGSDRFWFWDILDIKTRFLLASHVSKNISPRHARHSLELAVKKARKLPGVLFTDQAALYSAGLSPDDADPLSGIKLQEVVTESSTRLLRSFNSISRAREIILKGFKHLKSARTIIDTWVVHYNYLRPGEIVTNNTPAIQAGIRSFLKARLR